MMRAAWHSHYIPLPSPAKEKLGMLNVDARIKRVRRESKKELGMQPEVVVDRPGLFLGKRHRFLTAREEERCLFKQPFSKIRHILILCNGVSLSSNLIRICAQKAIPIDFTDGIGRHIARIPPPLPFEAANGLAQLEALTNGKGQALVSRFAAGKVRNQLFVLRYFLKYPANRKKAETAGVLKEQEQLVACQEKIKAVGAPDIENLRKQVMALEAEAAKSYWSIITGSGGRKLTRIQKAGASGGYG